MSGANTYAIVVTAIAIFGGLVVLIVKLFDYFTKKRLDEEIIIHFNEVDERHKVICTKIYEIHEKLTSLYSLHNIKDSNGTPIWYIPRDWAQIQRDIVNALQHISTTQSEMAGILKRMDNANDNSKTMVDVLEKINNNLTEINSNQRK